MSLTAVGSRVRQRERKGGGGGGGEREEVKQNDRAEVASWQQGHLARTSWEVPF